jgi:hypothetical protein
LRNLEQSISALYKYIPDAERYKPSVSTVSTGWHIAHSMLVIIKITETVAHSDPAEYVWKFNLPRVLAFTLNRFPRGRGKAPASVKPDLSQTPDFKALFAKARQAVETLKSLQPDQYFVHPVFGALNKKNTFTMLNIHTRHHLAIIRDIVSTND